jgi:hypothetical protein
MVTELTWISVVLYIGLRRVNHECLSARHKNSYWPYLILLSLAPQLSLGLGLLHKIRLNFLEASQQFSFLQGRVVSPTPNPHLGGPGLCIYILQRQGGPVNTPGHRVPILLASYDTHELRWD